MELQRHEARTGQRVGAGKPVGPDVGARCLWRSEVAARGRRSPAWTPAKAATDGWRLPADAGRCGRPYHAGGEGNFSARRRRKRKAQGAGWGRLAYLLTLRCGSTAGGGAAPALRRRAGASLRAPRLRSEGFRTKHRAGWLKLTGAGLRLSSSAAPRQRQQRDQRRWPLCRGTAVFSLRALYRRDRLAKSAAATQPSRKAWLPVRGPVASHAGAGQREG
jgi:hypothetical protein